MGDIITKDWELFKYQSEDGTFHELYVKRINGKDFYHFNTWCKLLDIDNPREAKRRLDPEDVILTDIKVKGRNNAGKTILLTKKMNFCTREGLLDLIMESRKPGTRKIRRWVTHEVIPSIMDTGKYELPEHQTPPLDMVKHGITADHWKRLTQNVAQVKKGFIGIIHQAALVLFDLKMAHGLVIPEEDPKTGRRIRLDIAMGKGFYKWLQKYHPDILDQYPPIDYLYVIDNGRKVRAKQYLAEIYRPLFAEYSVYFLRNNGEAYFSKRLEGENKTKAIEFFKEYKLTCESAKLQLPMRPNNA